MRTAGVLLVARAPSVAFLAAAGALLILGLWVFYEAAVGLIRLEHSTIGGITLFGETIWLGWLMIAALLYSGIPPVIIGRLQMANGRRLNDKVLYADGSMRKADWLTASAAILGILGIGYGFWLADAALPARIATLPRRRGRVRPPPPGRG